jgi:hypothetical protein
MKQTSEVSLPDSPPGAALRETSEVHGAGLPNLNEALGYCAGRSLHMSREMGHPWGRVDAQEVLAALNV